MPLSDDLARMNENRPDRNPPSPSPASASAIAAAMYASIASAYLGRKPMLLAMMRTVKDLRAFEELESAVAGVWLHFGFDGGLFVGGHRLEIAHDLEILSRTCSESMPETSVAIGSDNTYRNASSMDTMDSLDVLPVPPRLFMRDRDDASLFQDGQDSVLKTTKVAIHHVQRHLDRVPRIRLLQHLQVNRQDLMAGEPQKANFSLFLGLESVFNRPPLAKIHSGSLS